MSREISIMLADDHSVVRQGIRALLEAEQDFKIVGEVSDGVAATEMAEKLRPNVLVLDMMMKGMNGLEVSRQVTRRSPLTNTIILSMYGNIDYVTEALKAGAKGYVLKDSSADELVQAIRAVMSGRRFLGFPLSEQVLDTYLQINKTEKADPYDNLTMREREILYMVAQGSTSAEIADKLFISRRTVEVHRGSLMRKLGMDRMAQLIRYAMQRGITSQSAG
jgi:two-component system, NarL family, response regulator NreC